MGYIGAHGVEMLHRHKYSGVDHSLVAKYILQPYWTRFVQVFPLWVPPNVITLTGFMFLATLAFLGYLYSPRLDSPPPRWVHFIHGVLLFLYQTFDAVDGKQARRTNSTSPLGELFDHVGSPWFWEYCYVWKGNFLVLGNCSYSIFWCNMGILLHQYFNSSHSQWAN